MARCDGEEKKEAYHDDEREIWENMTPAAWHNSVTKEGSIFHETYTVTRAQIEREIKEGGCDVVIEVGCGTGDIIGALDTNVDRYGLDINPDFVDFCKSNYDNCTFLVLDAVVLADWWKDLSAKYKKPLVTCVNNTLNIMPETIRGQVVAQMIEVAGSEGRCLATYWNGNFFSHAVMNYYKANEDLCGAFDVMEHVNWDRCHLLTPTGYSTEWMVPVEVQKHMRSFDVEVKDMKKEQQPGTNHLNMGGLAIFVWFCQESTSRGKGNHDSDDAVLSVRSPS